MSKNILLNNMFFLCIINPVMKMNKETYEKIINYIMSHGVDFAETYYEEIISKRYSLNDSKIQNVGKGTYKGIGIRIYHNDNVYYTSTNHLDYESIINSIDLLLSNIKNRKDKKVNIKLEDEEILLPKIEIEHDSYPTDEKIKLIKNIDNEVRNYSKLINQVNVAIDESVAKYTITNSKGIYKTSQEVTTMIRSSAFAKRKDVSEHSFNSFGKTSGYELLKDFDYIKFSKEIAELAIKKLDAKKFKGGTVPVVIEHGFGAVIFHEACGHALEATSVADNLSVLSNKLNKKIASEKVTLIDDGSISNMWGTTLIDSEGNKTRKNVLIEKGILKSYLVDDFNSKKMKHEITGSSRRQNYSYPPTSRMNNTYLDKGTDKIEDMIKSIDYGVYCKKMGGGSVDPKTGDFNFTVDEAYLIEKGKITDMIKGITLIGKGQEILKEVEMVSDDLELSPGFCGSVSGNICVTIGQPTIKISKILVGGSN